MDCLKKKGAQAGIKTGWLNDLEQRGLCCAKEVIAIMRLIQFILMSAPCTFYGFEDNLAPSFPFQIHGLE